MFCNVNRKDVNTLIALSYCKRMEILRTTIQCGIRINVLRTLRLLIN